MATKELTKQDTHPTFSDSEASDDGGGVIIYSDEELSAMRQVRGKLTEEHGIEPSRVGSVFLAVATINCKLRVDETAKKIVKMLELMEQLGCPDGIDDELWKPDAKSELHSYPSVGTDYRGCRITWINSESGKGVAKEEERNHCHACIMQYLSVHADARTLRNGITFIIDTTGSNKAKKIGNEKIIQAFYQSIPQRPQIILIAGASVLMRTVINASIKVASLFIKQKILERIHFVTVEDAISRIPTKSAPVYVGGEGGGIENHENWYKERLGQLPKPDLSEGEKSSESKNLVKIAEKEETDFEEFVNFLAETKIDTGKENFEVN
eukprot:CAMPEP_0181117968 /NCGR_PEP_ID=MMETSP1071-20121207/22821_1 /TAXON_ID=35127 /ORGANISM="Thalassiosira sp., Strain NH16" /LENGTH=323 /DNA_ID=CAMNT_0023202423 /DNA_START=98 /DNA_END=1069 /DNA_ORIENTATION=+